MDLNLTDLMDTESAFVTIEVVSRLAPRLSRAQASYRRIFDDEDQAVEPPTL